MKVRGKVENDHTRFRRTSDSFCGYGPAHPLPAAIISRMALPRRTATRTYHRAGHMTACIAWRRVLYGGWRASRSHRIFFPIGAYFSLILSNRVRLLVYRNYEDSLYVVTDMEEKYKYILTVIDRVIYI